MVSTSNAPADFFDFNLKYLFYVGLWPREDWPPTLNWLYRIYEVTLMLFAFAFLTSTGIGMYMSKDDVITFLTNMDKAIVAYNFTIKIVIFFFKRKHIRVLISEILHSGDKIDKNRQKLMMIHVVAISGMITTIIGSFQTFAQMKGEMVVDAWLPFDPRKNMWTVFIAGQILGVLFVVPVIYRAIAIQGIVCSIIMYMCDQLIELQGRLKALTYSVENESYMREEFKDIIRKHIRLMGYNKLFNYFYLEF